MDKAQAVAATAEAGVANGLSMGGMAAVTLLVGLATVLWMWVRKPKDKPDGGDEDADGDWEEEEPVHKDVPPEHMPEDGVFTEESLKPLDGKDLPLCMGVCGKVVNCSISGSIRHGQGYGKLWAGRDATYSLATLSLNPDDASRRDFKLEDFAPEQQKALAGWYKHFTTKYPVIGTMREYDGWDFSSIEELAKDQTPFGLKADGPGPKGDENTPQESGAAAPPDSKAAAAEAPSLPSDAQVFSKGDRVQLRNLDASPELNGLTGILEDYIGEQGRFVIKVESNNQTMLFKPENLLILK